MPKDYFAKKGNKKSGGGPFRMAGYSYPITSPTKNRRTKSSAISSEDAFAHNASSATASHFGHPHGPKPTEKKEE